MDLVPVADEREDQQHESDQQQARGFRGINRVPMMLVRSILFGLGGEHEDIVALQNKS